MTKLNTSNLSAASVLKIAIALTTCPYYYAVIVVKKFVW